MLQIEITQLGKHFPHRYQEHSQHAQSSTNHQQQKPTILRQMSSNDGPHKKIVPIKEYSNRFLRESASKQNCREKMKNNRLNSIVTKHKNFQKKYQKVLGRKNYICKTEPNENQYQCFSTIKNFYRPEKEMTRIKTQHIIDKRQKRLVEQPQELLVNIEDSIFDQNESKDTIKCQEHVYNKKEDKISTSRALELFSRIVSKDRGQLLDKIRICNQKKMLKQQLMESSKNLEAKQIVLLEKTKKYSFIQRGERKGSIKTSIKYRKKQSQAERLCIEQNDFQIKGWDFPY